MSFTPGQELQKTAYDELLVANPIAKVQISARYGLLTEVLTITDLVGSGSTAAQDSMFFASTGTDADGFAALLSKRQMQTKAGIGGLARLDGRFDTPVADNWQRAGIQNSEDGAVFAYFGTTFGILYYHGGKDETQTLTVTIGAAGVESATVTVDSVAYSVPLTANAGTVTNQLHTAIEIAASLTTQNPNYLFSANETNGVITVIAQSQISGPAGSFAFTSATAVAAWVQNVDGVNPDNTFVAQSAWNGDSDIADDLNPLKLNEFQIRFNGNLEFSIYNPGLSMFEVVHTVKHSNNFETPLFGNPTFRIGWSTFNVGNTTNITICGSESAMLQEGEDSKSNVLLSAENVILSAPLAATTIIVIRNRFHFNGRYNRANLILDSVDLTTESSKIGIFEIHRNPVFTDDMEFSYSNIESSTGEISYTASTLISSDIAPRINVKSTNPREIRFDTRDDVFEIIPGETIALSARVSQNPAALMQAVLTGMGDP